MRDALLPPKEGHDCSFLLRYATPSRVPLAMTSYRASCSLSKRSLGSSEIRNLDHFGKVHEVDLADDADDALPVLLRDGQSLPAEFFLLRPGGFLLHMGEVCVGREGDMRERWVGLEYVGIERVRISAGAHKDDPRDFAAFVFRPATRSTPRKSKGPEQACNQQRRHELSHLAPLPCEMPLNFLAFT